MLKNISKGRKKNSETCCEPTEAKLFYLVALGLNSMLDVRAIPDIKLSIHKRQLNMVQNK